MSGDARVESVLVLPGLNDSGPGHWQSLWQARHPGFRRVQQASWDAPLLADWVAALEQAVRASPAGTVLVAHSLGCALAAHWARSGSVARVAAALLVTPPDVDRLALPEIASFAPMPLDPLPFPATVVGSADDPYAAIERVRGFVAAWGARFVDAGRCGHLNTDAGFGEWPAGEALLDQLLAGR